MAYKWLVGSFYVWQWLEALDAMFCWASVSGRRQLKWNCQKRQHQSWWPIKASLDHHFVVPQMIMMRLHRTLLVQTGPKNQTQVPWGMWWLNIVCLQQCLIKLYDSNTAKSETGKRITHFVDMFPHPKKSYRPLATASLVKKRLYRQNQTNSIVIKELWFWTLSSAVDSIFTILKQTFKTIIIFWSKCCITSIKSLCRCREKKVGRSKYLPALPPTVLCWFPQEVQSMTCTRQTNVIFFLFSNNSHR